MVDSTRGHRVRPSPRVICWRLLGWGALAVVHAVALVLSLPDSLGWSTRIRVLTHCAAQLLTVGVALVCVGASARWAGARFEWLSRGRTSERHLFLAGVVVVLIPLAWLLAQEDFAGLAERHAGSTPPGITMGAGALISASLLAALVYFVKRCKGPWLRWLGALVAFLLAIASAFVVPRDYPGLVTCTVIAAGLALSTLPSRFGALRAAVERAGIRRSWPVLVGVSMLGPGTLFALDLDNATRLSLSSQRSAVLNPLLNRMDQDVPPPGTIPIDQVQWFSDRSDLPTIAPSGRSTLPHDGIVILLGVDALRADLLATDRYAKRLPELTRLRREGVWFSEARSPGASTVPALSAMFSGQYYSQTFWHVHPERPPGVYPHQDEAKRFPEALAERGITTLTVDTAGWLTNEFGVVRGFAVERTLRKKGYPRAERVARALIEQLEAQTGPTFAFAHFLDAHAPYDSAGRVRSPFEGYLRELALVDRALGRLRQFLLTSGMSERTCLIVYADHGESFGEHGHKYHASTLYDTLLRVPLIFHCPRLTPQRVDAPVSLMDVGPTILDLFNVHTPPHVIGERLTGFLIGEPPHLTRPIFAEARLKQALVAEEHKVIFDTRSGGVEVYDLQADPGELKNIYDPADEESTNLLTRLRTFFDTHTYRAVGYEVPYRKW